MLTGPRTPQSSPRASRRLGLKIFVALNFFFFGSVLVDHLAGFVVPAIPVRVVHPPNLRERRKSIEFSVEFRTNAQGLRYREIPLSKQSENEFRVVVLGDSMTEGWGVESEETFSAVLEKSLSNAQRTFYFINAGLAGTGPLEYGRNLAMVGLKYHPDLVLIALHTNDLSDTPEGAELDVARNWLGQFQVKSPKSVWPPGGLIHKTAFFFWPWSYARLQNAVFERDKTKVKRLGLIDRVNVIASRAGIPEARVREWAEKVPSEIVAACDRGEFNAEIVAMGCLYPDSVIQELDVQGDVAEKHWASMRHLLGQIVDLCRQQGINVGVVYTPTALQYDETIGKVRKTVGVRFRREWLTEESSEIERRLTRWAGDAGVPFLSLTGTFREAARKFPGRFNYVLDEHWTAEGHKVAAKGISKWLTEQELVR